MTKHHYHTKKGNMLMFWTNYYSSLTHLLELLWTNSWNSNNRILNLLIWDLGGVVLSKKYCQHQRQIQIIWKFTVLTHISQLGSLQEVMCCFLQWTSGTCQQLKIIIIINFHEIAKYQANKNKAQGHQKEH